MTAGDELPVVVFTVVHSIGEADVYAPRGAEVVDADGEMTVRYRRCGRDVPDGATGYSVAEAARTGAGWVGAAVNDGRVVAVEVTRRNPAYLGPDVLFGEPPSETITERVEGIGR